MRFLALPVRLAMELGSFAMLSNEELPLRSAHDLLIRMYRDFACGKPAAHRASAHSVQAGR
ncbi:MAG: hypothetical protein D6741_08740 [Planctomycetota bacterium]|nr:MAG: hypothetical protein D6741_08740 [Planctomycetota bacterium]